MAVRFLRYKIETDSGLMQFTIVRLQLERDKQGIGQGGRGGGGGEAVKNLKIFQKSENLPKI